MKGTVRTWGILVSTAAAFIWATYYLFVLALPRIPDLAITVYPFLFGGLGFTLLSLRRSRKEPGKILRMMGTPGGLGRGVLILGMQLDVVLSTRFVGAVDTSLLTLLADVLATPLLLYALWREGEAHLRHPLFWAGLVLSAAGAGLTIVGGGGAHSLGPEALLIGAPIPILVAIYFLLASRAAREAPMERVVGSSTLLGGFLAGAATVALDPGSLWISASPVPWALLALLGLTSFFLAPWAYFWATSQLTIVIPAVLQAAIPVFTLILVALVLHAPVASLALVGIPVAFLGSVLAVSEPRRGPRPPPGEGRGSAVRVPRASVDATSGRDPPTGR